MDERPESSQPAVSPEAPGTLELMRLLEQHPEYSQRQLSAALGVSVGKAHYLLKALMDKGLVKAKNFRHSNNKVGYLYVLTPTGVRQRWRLTQEFLFRKEKEYLNLKTQIIELRKEVATASEPTESDLSAPGALSSPASAPSRSR